MNRKLLLTGILLILFLCTVVYHIWAGWGLITVHAKAQPLSQIVSQIQRQGHVTLKTDIAGDTPVTMNVDKVPLTEALETLAATTDGRWRLSYVLAPDKAAVQTAIDDFVSGQRPEGWKQIYIPMPNVTAIADDAPIPDPRGDVWNVKAPADATLQAYLDDAAKSANAAFSFPESWNPTIKSTPSSGEITHVIPKLASAAGGKVEEIFVLTKGSGGRRMADNDGGGQGGDYAALPTAVAGGDNTNRPRRPEMDPAAMEQRMQAEIDKLPAASRGPAQARFNKEREFWKSLRDLPPDQRMQKIQDHMNDPEVQQRMDDRQANRDSRQTPNQRQARYQNYVQHKAAIKAAQ